MNISGNEFGYAKSVTPSRGSQNIARLKLYRCNEKLQQRMIQVWQFDVSLKAITDFFDNYGLEYLYLKNVCLELISNNNVTFLE